MHVVDRKPLRRRWILAMLAVAGMAATASLDCSRHESEGSRSSPSQTANGRLRALCIQNGTPPHVIAEAQGGELLRCPKTAVLQFSYTSGDAIQLAIVGVSESGAVVPYFPRQLGSAPIEHGTARSCPIPYGLPLADHPKGKTHVSAIYADRSLEGATVEAMVLGKGTPAGVITTRAMDLLITP